jgi:thioredoxin 1
MVASLTSKPELQQVLASAGERVVCVKFTAKWCGPCKKIQPVLQELEHKYSQFMVYESDVDVSTELVSHFKIVSMPTFVFMWRNKVVYTLKGADPKLLAVVFEVMAGMTK